ncbi:CzcE family metal-binding protein [Pelomonas sp. CA6]|uniref:CzcE family metal-binding protein n=1 Tax=Pelomonas sp. CA6 TaxID=2907999 RepID=UPI001F4C0E90|nr:CzcE family metal-binding protein [Pelomonas sp. CA6]MCH7345295.1 CzcE family metal-binding protein [Pelomonas sp. CA6]
MNSRLIARRIAGLGALAALATAASLAQAATPSPTFANGRSIYGVPTQGDAGARVVDVNQVRQLNVVCGDVVTFRNGEQRFSWKFDVASHAPVDLQRIAPAGFAAQNLRVYVQRNDLEMN